MKGVEFFMSEKTCSKCKRELPLDNFRWKNKAKGQKHSQCKDCQKAQEKIHYQESKERQDSVVATANFQKESNLSLVNRIRESGCKKCGEKRIYILDFHHRDPSQKEKTINRMIKSSSYDNLLAEIEKCDVLCANCHREFHYFEKLNGMSYEDYLK